MSIRTAVLAAVAVVGVVAAGGACTSKDMSYCDEQVPCADSRDVCNLELKLCERASPADGGGDAARDGAADAVTSDTAVDVGGDGDDAATGDAGGDAGAGDGGDDGSAPDGGCTSPLRECAGGCYALDDPAHCGSGCTPCDTPANGNPTCDGTSCGIACNASYWANVTSCDPCDNAGHCGATCATCSGGTPDCQGGQSGKCVCNSTSCGGVTPVCEVSTGQCRACVAHGECATNMCGDDGACVAEADIIYVAATGCSDGGSGTSSLPYCTFATALSAATAGPRNHILVRAGDFGFSGSQQIVDQRVVIVGMGIFTSSLRQDAAGATIFSVRGTASVWISNIGLYFPSSLGGHGIVCDGQGSTATLTLDQVGLRSAGGHGIEAIQCALSVRQSLVWSNTGLGLHASASNVVVRQTKVMTNKGGGLHLAGGAYTLENCLVMLNGGNGSPDPESAVGGVKLENPTGTRVFINNTVVDNDAGSTVQSAGVWCVGTATVTNSIIYTNSPGQQFGCTVSYSDVQDGTTTNGNITSDPKFVDFAHQDFHLSTSPDPSPCINLGTPTGAPTVDLDGYPRAGNPDMGCYEAH